MGGPTGSGRPADAHAGDLAPEAMHEAQRFVHAGVRHLHDTIRTADVVVACKAGDIDGHLPIIAGARVAHTCGNLHGESKSEGNSGIEGVRTMLN